MSDDSSSEGTGQLNVGNPGDFEAQHVLIL